MSDELGSVRATMFERAKICGACSNSLLITHNSSLLDLARLRTYPQHTCAWLPLLRSRPGGVHRRGVVRSPKSDNLSSHCRFPIVDFQLDRLFTDCQLIPTSYKRF